MKKTLINQALKNAVGQESCGNTSVQAEKTDPAALSAREFEDFLASIVTGVIQNVVDVRAGKLKPDEASSRDDATVRTLAQILMGEHERIRLMLAPGTPKPGPELVAAMKANLPALFAICRKVLTRGIPVRSWCMRRGSFCGKSIRCSKPRQPKAASLRRNVLKFESNARHLFGGSAFWATPSTKQKECADEMRILRPSALRRRVWCRLQQQGGSKTQPRSH